MKRLIYCPKAYVFIRSSNLNGRVFDVSSDVVRGSVTQNVNDVSKATFELRNRYRKWIRSPEDGNLQIFLPMDMVTIWLQRVSGKPIQVFTGYLDTVPFYQGYPGNASFEATCTLKKLAFTWFDPGLSFFQSWVISNGWTYDQSTGEALNPAAFQDAHTIGANQALAKAGAKTTVNDTGFDALLGRFMTEVAGWSTDDVLISALPADLPKLAAKLYSKIEGDTEAELSNLEKFLSAAMGVNGWQNPDASTPTSTNGAPTKVPAVTQLTQTISARAKINNIPANVLIFAAYVLSGLSANRSISPNVGNVNWGYGLYALRPAPLAGKTVPGFINSPVSAFASTIDGKTPADLLDAATATDVFCKLLNANQGSWAAGARKGDLGSIQAWIEAALGRKLPGNVDLTKAYKQAQQIAGASVVVTPPTNAPSVVISPATFNWKSAQLLTLLNSGEKQIITKYYAKSKPWLASVLFMAKQIDRNITLSAGAPSNPATISLTGKGQSMATLFGSLQGNAAIDSVSLALNGKTTHLKNGVVSNINDTVPVGGGKAMMTVSQSKSPPTDQQIATGSDPNTSSSPSALTPNAFPTISYDSTFAANFSFPSNAIEAMYLVGNKALMNDVSCLDGVKQFCKGSLRAFRSLPDGRFLAFYPDYFGAYRKPYWEISNIELTDFGIQLNDDSLATHVYVVGDTFGADGAITYQDDIASRGVATLTQAFMLDSFIETYAAPKDASATLVSPDMGRLKQAYEFLQHYGARPHKEEQPLIRNTFYEFLMAWQRFMELWAQQFATSISFTFQPEVMAGGLIAFPDHDVQMFCQSVTHAWDYESGFQTDATMTAPSLMASKQVDRQSKPGFALAGNINSVGSD